MKTLVIAVFALRSPFTPLPLQPNNGVWLMKGFYEGDSDLVYIKTRNTGRGRVEVHVASRLSDYQSRVFGQPTTFVNESDGTWTMTNIDPGGYPDLAFVKTANTPTGRVEVHLASGSSSYQSRRVDAVTAFANENDGTWSIDAFQSAGGPDLAFIRTANTPSGRVEIHVVGSA